MHRPRRRLEIRRLRRARRGGLLRAQLQQPGVLRPQPRQLSRNRRRNISHAHNLSAAPDVPASRRASICGDRLRYARQLDAQRAEE